MVFLRKKHRYSGLSPVLLLLGGLLLGSCSLEAPQGSNLLVFTNNSQYLIEVIPGPGSGLAAFTLAPSTNKSVTSELSATTLTFSYSRASRVQCEKTGQSVIFGNLPTRKVTVWNTTAWTLQVADGEDDNFDPRSIEAGKIGTLESTSNNDTFLVSGQQGPEKIHQTIDTNFLSIFQYDYIVEYFVEGTATVADITYENADGVRETHLDVALPVRYALATKVGNSAYISATNKGTGSVAVRLLTRGMKSSEGESTGIVTASADW